MELNNQSGEHNQEQTTAEQEAAESAEKVTAGKEATLEKRASVALPEPDAPHQDPPPEFTVAGIGASAGGLDALRSFLAPIPPDSGMGFVVVVHLSPEHQSLLAELLQPHTEMPVTQVTELVKMEPNHVYVIPPNRNLSTIDTHLRLSPLEEARRERAPIDHFFRTLARTHDSKAIGIVLSGGGSDGAVGLKAIKEAGGLILAQDPVEAAYDSMPQSAIATGVVDEVLPVAEMAERLLTYLKTWPQLAPLTEPTAGDEAREEGALLQKVFARLRSVTGHDFSRYKRGTITRRLARRMALRGLTSLEEYLDLLRADPDEVRALFRDLLIVVTSFFREPDAFETLAEEVIPELFAEKGADGEVRVWVPGCATGEEAYSLAIMLLEEANRMDHPPAIQIFATDLSAEGLAVGREGVYPEAIVADVPQPLLERYFTRHNGSFRVREQVRERVLFAQHSLLKDPPFSHVDLVSCRNLLIYLQRDVQRQVLELFHYALNPDGFLFLGASESVDERDLFHGVDGRHSIYRRQSVNIAPRLPSLPLRMDEEVVAGPVAARRQRRGSAADNHGSLHQQLVERHAPPSILVDEDHRIVHISERAGRYLRMAGGAPTVNVLHLVRDELQAELATLVYRAFNRNRSSRSAPLTVKIEGVARAVSLYVEPAEEKGRSFALIFFLESDVADAERALPLADATRDGAVQELEEELAATKSELRTAVEEFESSKEEMRSSNEELQSINEELRSTTEELETSKEELQSMNEELVTVNEENRQKVDELRQLTADLQNLMAATDIATLFLDRRLQIQRFTPAASTLFNIRHSDRGRPLAHLTHRLASYDGLLDDAERVLQTLVPVEEEVADDDGRHYFLRIRPYRTAEDRIEGVVITLVDITPLREAEEALRESEERFRALVNASAQIVWTTDAAGQVVEDSPSWRAFTGQTVEQWLGAGWADAVHPDDRAEAVEAWRQAVEVQTPFDVEFRLQHVSGEWRWVHTRGVPLYDEADEVRGWVGMNADITERKQAEEALRQSEERLRRIFEIATVGLIFFDETGTMVDANDTFLQKVGYSRRELEAGELTWQKLTPPEWMDDSYQQLAQMEESGRIGPYEKEYFRKDGSRWWFLFAGIQLDDGGVVEFVVDLSEQKAAERALRESQQELAALAAALEERVAARTVQVRLLASELVASEQTVRHRISQTLHDDLQQLLYAAEIQLQLIRQRSPQPEGQAAEAKAELDELAEMLEAAIAVTRQLTVELSPPVLEGEGLPEALAWLAGHMREVYGLKVTVEVDPRPRLSSEEQRILLFQIVRELLFNVVKHAGVEEARVAVAGLETGLQVTVSDQGQGFDVEQALAEDNSNFGLSSVRERIALFDGGIEILSEPGEGTRVTLFLPSAVLGPAGSGLGGT